MPVINGARLRARRDELDYSNAELAQRMKISPGYLNNILGGSAIPGDRVVYRFARVLDLPLDEIVAAKRTPAGDPSEPPRQPPNAPKSPPPGRGNDTRAPGRVTARVG